MNIKRNDPAQLEALVARQLAALPPRRAPASLEARVMQALAAADAAAALPWYRSNFRRWPLLAQIAFALIAVVAAHWLMQALGGVSTVVPSQLAQEELSSTWSVLRALGTAYDSSRNSLAVLIRTVPSSWQALATVTALSCYALVMFTGALVYRSIRR